MAPRRVGSGLEARYEIIAELARGGMAELFIARPRGGDGGLVVLKRILPEHARKVAFVTMFLDEARLASRLGHPNVARVLDVGRYEDTFAFVMEHVHGKDLRHVLQEVVRRRLRMPVELAVAILAAAATGLHAAHELLDGRGIALELVHRDVSPSNVMVGFDGSVKILDFGIAQSSDRMTETGTGVIKGKVAYLSPEQCRQEAIDRRSDIFSLGIVAWELLAQRRLFAHDGELATMNAIVDGAIPPLSRHAPAVPAALEAVVARALAREPDARHATAAELATALVSGLGRPLLGDTPDRLAGYLRLLFAADAPPIATDGDSHEVTAPRRRLTGDRTAPDDAPAGLQASREVATTLRVPIRALVDAPRADDDASAAATAARLAGVVTSFGTTVRVGVPAVEPPDTLRDFAPLPPVVHATGTPADALRPLVRPAAAAEPATAPAAPAASSAPADPADLAAPAAPSLHDPVAAAPVVARGPATEEPRAAARTRWPLVVAAGALVVAVLYLAERSASRAPAADPAEVTPPAAATAPPAVATAPPAEPAAPSVTPIVDAGPAAAAIDAVAASMAPVVTPADPAPARSAPRPGQSPARRPTRGDVLQTISDAVSVGSWRQASDICKHAVARAGGDARAVEECALASCMIDAGPFTTLYLQRLSAPARARVTRRCADGGHPIQAR